MCQAHHHSLLHKAYAFPKLSELSALFATRQDEDCKAIWLATAKVIVTDCHENPLDVRAH